LQEVVVDPYFVVELVDGDGLGDGIEAVVAQVSSDQARVLLFDEAIVVLVVRSAAGEGNTLDNALKEAKQVVVEELGLRAQLSRCRGGVRTRERGDEPGCSGRRLP
jgi:hypothetical protein